MKILNVELTNFASYEHLKFEYQNQGLTLIHGATGSGKSTLMDAIPWVLYGQLSKGGNAAEVLSWPGDKITTGVCYLTTSSGLDIMIRRTRASKAKDNDLYYTQRVPDVRDEIRGKDIPDTQRLINNLLGADADTMTAATNYHEFTPAASFFAATAKNRRALCEQMVDLSLPIKLHERLSARKKDCLNDKETAERQLSGNTGQLARVELQLKTTKKQRDAWAVSNSKKLVELEAKSLSFDSDKEARIGELAKAQKAWNDAQSRDLVRAQNELNLASEAKDPQVFFDWEKFLDDAESALKWHACDKCGSPLEHEALKNYAAERHEMEMQKLANNNLRGQHRRAQAKMQEILDRVNPYTEQLKYQESLKNTYLDQISSLFTENNPHLQTVYDLKRERNQLKDDIEHNTQVLAGITQDLTDTLLLLDIVADFRSALIANTLSDLESKTNTLLTDHFDAEIRVVFSAQDADKVEVEIMKDGNLASFTQLSKGQRQLLKLAFGVSVMKVVANRHALAPNVITIDEFADSLSDELKIKAFGLLQSLALEYSCVLVAEHSEAMKACFDNRYHVTLDNGRSKIEKST